MGDDVFSSYTGFRTIERGDVGGVQRIKLNGDTIFPFGTLDQVRVTEPKAQVSKCGAEKSY